MTFSLQFFVRCGYFGRFGWYANLGFCT